MGESATRSGARIHGRDEENRRKEEERGGRGERRRAWGNGRAPGEKQRRKRTAEPPLPCTLMNEGENPASSMRGRGEEEEEGSGGEPTQPPLNPVPPTATGAGNAGRRCAPPKELRTPRRFEVDSFPSASVAEALSLPSELEFLPFFGLALAWPRGRHKSPMDQLPTTLRLEGGRQEEREETRNRNGILAPHQ